MSVRCRDHADLGDPHKRCTHRKKLLRQKDLSWNVCFIVRGSFSNLEFNSKDEGYNQDSGGGFKKLVYQYNLEGELQNTFEDLQEAANTVEVSKKSISAACLGKIKTCKGFYWNYDLLDAYVPIMDRRRKEVLQMDADGNVLATYLSVAEASRLNGIGKSPIAKTCRGEQDHTGGYFWKYSN